MKKSKIISLVLIGTALASCNKEKETGKNNPKVHMRADSTAAYTRTGTHSHHGGSNALLWYYAFRPFGQYNNGSYQSAGFYSGGLNEASNIGNNSTKSGIVRGGLGRSGHTVSS